MLAVLRLERITRSVIKDKLVKIIFPKPSDFRLWNKLQMLLT